MGPPGFNAALPIIGGLSGCFPSSSPVFHFPGDLFCNAGEILQLLRAKVTQYVGSDLSFLRSPHPNPDPVKIAMPKTSHDVSEAVVAFVTAILLQPHIAKGKLHFIVQYDEVLCIDIGSGHGFLQWTSRTIHIGHGLEQNELHRKEL